jgi:hypothetical protein
MAAMLKAGAKGMTREQMEKVVPDQVSNALSHGIRYGLISE